MKCQKTIELFYLDTTKDNLLKSTEIEDYKTSPILKRIREICNHNLEQGGIHKEYVFYDYLHLLTTLKSMLNVCIICLQEEADVPDGITHLDVDVKNTLVSSQSSIDG